MDVNVYCYSYYRSTIVANIFSQNWPQLKSGSCGEMLSRVAKPSRHDQARSQFKLCRASRFPFKHSLMHLILPAIKGGRKEVSNVYLQPRLNDSNLLRQTRYLPRAVKSGSDRMDRAVKVVTRACCARSQRYWAVLVG